MRKIIHLDMDCFYAAIEVRNNPALRGQPVAVGGARDRRGVLTTCNYEARKFGLRSAMPTWMAIQKCPHLIVVPVHFEAYRHESARVRALMADYTERIEPLSLDEAYLDVSALDRPPAEMAAELRRRIYRTTGLTASAGIGPNKLIAKIASDWNKPDGQLEVQPGEVANFMRDLPVRRIWGIGRVAAEKLERNGVTTCGGMQALPAWRLQELFGRFGLELYHLCRGEDDRPVEPHRERKSLSSERTYTHDLRTIEECLERLARLHEELVADLRKHGEARRVTGVFVKLKFSDFSQTTVARGGGAPEFKLFRELMEEGFGRSGQPVRLLGIGVRFAEESAEEETQLELPL
ncbi:MAG: DNA polymerase IV [Opitutaceae bacterium]